MNFPTHAQLMTASTSINKLTKLQRAVVFMEGSPAFFLTTSLWFIGTASTMVASAVSEASKNICYLIAAIFFIASLCTLNRVFKGFQEGTTRHTLLRKTLKMTGMKKSSRFISEHPAHVSAYSQLLSDLGSPGEYVFASREFFKNHLIAMIAFTGEDRDKSGPSILSIVNERGITDPVDIEALLTGMESSPMPLAGGAL